MIIFSLQVSMRSKSLILNPDTFWKSWFAFWSVVKLCFKIRFYLGSFDRKYVLSPIIILCENYFVSKSETWKLPFKNWRVIKWLYHILTRFKNLDSNFDVLQKIGLKSDSFSIFLISRFETGRVVRKLKKKCNSLLKFWFENCFHSFSKKAFLWKLIFRKSRKCQLSHF